MNEMNGISASYRGHRTWIHDSWGRREARATFGLAYQSFDTWDECKQAIDAAEDRTAATAAAKHPEENR